MAKATSLEEKRSTRNATQLPEPTGWKILIALPDVDEQTEAGIYKPDKALEIEAVSTVLGCVLKMGSLAYRDEKKFPTGPWCEVGDWVLMRAFSGTRIKIHGKEFRLINDDTIEAVVDDPRGIERA
mgnify:CR=1 FL=1